MGVGHARRIFPTTTTSSVGYAPSNMGYTNAVLTNCQNFRGQHITESDPNERNMTTGRHVVRDIHCRQCKETVGWKYDKAYEPSEKYKEGKFILEAELLCTVS
jgi:hypothetical protein